jgi:hypothetical protein
MMNIAYYVTEVKPGTYQVLRAGRAKGVPLNSPAGGVFGQYTITGPPQIIRGNAPPSGEVPKDAVIQWAQRFKDGGCHVRPGNYGKASVQTIDHS